MAISFVLANLKAMGSCLEWNEENILLDSEPEANGCDDLIAYPHRMV
jgi:hypothetical protein